MWPRLGQIVGAIRNLLDQSNWKAGDHNVAFQSCDDATAQAGKWDSGKCSTNAQAYASNEAVVGVIGTFNSGCAAIEIPVLNQAPGGGVVMISPANTLVCITEGGPGCDDTEPDKYYPSGTRNYARVVWNDQFQGAANAEYAKERPNVTVKVNTVPNANWHDAMFTQFAARKTVNRRVSKRQSKFKFGDGLRKHLIGDGPSGFD